MRAIIWTAAMLYFLDTFRYVKNEAVVWIWLFGVVYAIIMDLWERAEL